MPPKAGVTVQVNVAEARAVPEEAVTVTFETPGPVGVPEIRPVGLTVSPAGRPVAVKVSGLPALSVALSCTDAARPTVPDWSPGPGSATVSAAVPVGVRVRVCRAAVRPPPTAEPVVSVQNRAGVVSAGLPAAVRPSTRPLYRLTRR